MLFQLLSTCGPYTVDAAGEPGGAAHPPAVWALDNVVGLAAVRRCRLNTSD